MHGATSVLGLMLVVISLSCCGCASLRSSGHPSSKPKDPARSSVYSLLYELASSESDVDKILIVKRESAETGDLIREIAKTFRHAKQQLEAFARNKPSIRLDSTQLPEAEEDTREAISSAMAKRLLSAKKGDFEILLLMSQAEALRYATYLAKEAKDIESDGIREDYFDQLSKQCEELYERVLSYFLSKRAESSK